MDILLTLAEKIKNGSSESNPDLKGLALLYNEFVAEVREKIQDFESSIENSIDNKKINQLLKKIVLDPKYSLTVNILEELADIEFMVTFHKNGNKNLRFNKKAMLGLGLFYISGYFEIQKTEQILTEIPSFIVFTGENARGKTLFLRAIASCLGEQKDNINPNTLISTFLYKDGRCAKQIFLKYSTIKQNLSIKFAAYGASRLLIQTPESMDSNKRNSNLASLFRSDVSLLNIEYWLKMRLLADEKDKVEKVLNLLCVLLPHIKKITYKKDTKEGVVFEYSESEKLVRLEQLSAGQKSIIAFVGDMIIRLWEQQPEIDEIADLQGIVLIDEIEAHLHPKWQREFPKMLHEIFPRVQFIVTTHSPIPILGMPEDTALFHVTKDSENGIQTERLYLDIKNMSPQQILTSPLFGIESLRSLYNENLKDFNTEENYQELLKNKEIKDRIKVLAEKFTFKTPEE